MLEAIGWLAALLGVLIGGFVLISPFLPLSSYDYETFLRSRSDAEKQWDEENGF